MMTEQELSRAKFIHDLRRMIDPVYTQGQYQDMVLPTPDHFWLHITDLPLTDGIAFFGRLEDEELIVHVPEIQYQPRGDYMDHFPPDCYRLTAKGRHVLDNPHDYVYEPGELNE